jgi:DeoR family transcriptional regulator, copper-sensing transcriptional repressor
MTILTDRQELLLEWLQTRRSALIAEIEERFGVSAATAYRDARALVDAGLALKTNGGVKLSPPAAPAPRLEGRCAFCGGTVNDRTTFILQMEDGSQLTACCPHCGLMALNRPKVLSALACDFIYGRMINARQAIFLVESIISLCCEPSVLCFTNEDEARRFQQGFQGRVCSLDQARARIAEIMALNATHP